LALWFFNGCIETLFGEISKYTEANRAVFAEKKNKAE
jgi:hypothetical protein